MDKQRIVMDQETKKFLSTPSFSKINISGREYILEKFISDKGYKSVVWKGLDPFNSPVVIKFSTYEDYIKQTYLKEAGKAARLGSYSQFARFYDADIFSCKEDSLEIKCVVFIEEFIDGILLEEYINTREITTPFITNYIKGMCNALNILKELGLRHDDLHPGNVMIAPPPVGELSREYKVKIIDLGSLKDYSAPFKKEKKDDHEWFCEHLRLLFNKLPFSAQREQKRPLSKDERMFQREGFPLLNSMVEEDRQIALFEPSKILAQFEHAYTRSQSDYIDNELRLEDPFDYISAEHIASDELLVRLFADSCPWVKEVTSPNPILLTGPRGCGKSMLFRRLSLKALLYKLAQDISSSQIVGFYISCSADIRNHFGLSSETMATRFKKEIVHYFNLLLTREIIQTLFLISKRADRNSLFGFGEIQEKEIHEFLINKLNIKEDRRLRLQGVSYLEHLLEIVDFEMSYCYEQFLRGLNLESTTPISFLTDLTKFLKLKLKYFEARTITFLVDDFSIHKISAPVQLIINPIIWDRQATHIFKLSTEKYGAERILDSTSESASSADSTREFREVDCGQYYMDLSDKSAFKDLINFAKDLLDRRLSLAGFEGKSEEIIGYWKYEESTLGKALRKHQKRYDQYHGLDIISQICSGDISALLEIYRNIFTTGDVKKNTKTLIPANKQHSAIESVSRRFYELIKTYYPYGEEMFKIVSSFGTLCRKILSEGKEMNNAKRGESPIFVPNETTRIEVDRISKDSEDWSQEQIILMKELIRRSIFIEMDPGRGRLSLGPTMRWQLRRIYCPAFKAGLMKYTAIKWTASDFKYFLTDPKEKCETEFVKWKASSGGLDLFANEENDGKS